LLSEQVTRPGLTSPGMLALVEFLHEFRREAGDLER
jgi:hypothetical protein